MLGLGAYLAIIEDDESAYKFERIYQTYRYRMYYICRDILKDQHLAEDALQEAFISITKRLGKIGDVTSRKTACYVFLIAKSRAIDMYRRVKRDYQREFPIEEYGLVSSYNTEEEIIGNEQNNEVAAAIRSLKPLSNQILELYLEKQLSRREIAILLNLQYDTIRKRINTALSELKEELHKRGIDE